MFWDFLTPFLLIVAVWFWLFFIRFIYVSARHGLNAYRERMEARIWEYWVLGSLFLVGYTLGPVIEATIEVPGSLGHRLAAALGVVTMPILVTLIYVGFAKARGILPEKRRRVAQIFFYMAYWYHGILRLVLQTSQELEAQRFAGF